MEQEDKDMSYGSINPNEVATLSLLGGGLGNSTREPYDGTVANNNTIRNGDEIYRQGRETRDALSEHGTDVRLETLQRQLSDSRFELSNMFQQGRVETLQQINDARAEAAACCCKLETQILTENNATRQLLLEQQIQSRDANIQAMQHAQILAACGRNGNGQGNN